MITNFKIFEREWWMNKTINKNQGNLFKKYGKYKHFIIKYPYYSHVVELEYFPGGTCLCNNDSNRSDYAIFYPIIDRDFNSYRMDDDDDKFVDKVIEFCEDAYGYDKQKIFYDFNDIEAANRLIDKIDKAYKAKFGPEYGVFDKK